VLSERDHDNLMDLLGDVYGEDPSLELDTGLTGTDEERIRYWVEVRDSWQSVEVLESLHHLSRDPTELATEYRWQTINHTIIDELPLRDWVDRVTALLALALDDKRAGRL